MIKKRRCHRYSKGFTLVELMLVIAIIAILAVVLIPKIGFMKENAFEAGRDMSIRHVHALITGMTAKYSPDTWWAPKTGPGGSVDSDNASSLNRRLEYELQNGVFVTADQIGEAYSANDTGFMNPYNKSIMVVNWSSWPGTDYNRPFVFITCDIAYRYSSSSVSQGNLKTRLAGSLVVWIDRDAPVEPMQLYYVDKGGKKCAASEVIYIE